MNVIKTHYKQVQTCSSCLTTVAIDPKKDLRSEFFIKDLVWTCPVCGHYSQAEKSDSEEQKYQRGDAYNVYYELTTREPNAEHYDRTGCLLVSRDGKCWFMTTKKYVHAYKYWAPTPKKEIGP